jgi:general secretion pathway protein I
MRGAEGQKSMRPRGFTLIEVLAALVIVSLGMLGVIEAVSQTASNGSYLHDKTIAHWVAMNQLTKVRLDTRAPKIAKTSDEVEMALRRWRWTMNVSQTPVETVRRIDINVAPADSKKSTSLASVTGFYGTAISPGVQSVPWSGQGPSGNGASNPANQPNPNTPRNPNNPREDDSDPTITETRPPVESDADDGNPRDDESMR